MTFRTSSAFLVSMLFTAAPVAADDTAHHRKVVAAVEAAVKTSQKSKATHRDDPIVFELQGWSQNGQLRKILASVPGEDGGGFEEYYLEEGKLLFVFRQYRGTNSGTGASATIEDRFYFKNGTMFKWLGSDKKPVAPDREDFQAEAARLTGNGTIFTAALTGKNSGKNPGKPTVNAGAVQQAEGTFTRIDDGDYQHWVMESPPDGELSFFILDPDATLEKVLAEPGPFTGRKCRVKWKTSVENIPEAGGKMKLKQILSVEWLGKK